MQNIILRREMPADRPAVHMVNEPAFGRPQEADLVDRLRDGCPGLFSLVAVAGVKVVGHILFSPAVIDGGHGSLTGMGLVPIAAMPELQRCGFGSALMRAGLGEIRVSGEPFVIVLGHPEYYPRFGFVPASRFRIRCEYDGVPDEAFMILVLKDEALTGIFGVARYRPEFADVP